MSIVRAALLDFMGRAGPGYGRSELAEFMRSVFDDEHRRRLDAGLLAVVVELGDAQVEDLDLRRRAVNAT